MLLYGMAPHKMFRRDRRLGQCYIPAIFLTKTLRNHAASTPTAIDIACTRISRSSPKTSLKLLANEPTLGASRLSSLYPITFQHSRLYSSSTTAVMSSSDNNNIERIRNQIQERSHTKWGFVIYRCTYEDDAAWERFLQILKQRAHQGLAAHDALDLVHSLDLKVHEDKASLSGASKDDVRARFLAWLSSDEAKNERYSQSKQLQQQRNAMVTTMLGLGARYSYCIHVDAAALQSVVKLAPKPPKPDLHGIGYVNLIDAMWEKPDPATYDYKVNDFHPEGYDPTDEGEPEIDGCKMEDVGWMKVGVWELLPAAYGLLQESGAYYVVYKRPPKVWVH